MRYVQVCPTTPVDGVCPEPLVWVQTSGAIAITYSEFVQILPQLVAVLLAAWGFRQLLRLIFNK